MRIVDTLPEDFIFCSELRTNDGNNAIKMYRNHDTGEYAVITDVAKVVIVPLNFQGYLGTMFTQNYIDHLERKLND